MNHNTPDLGAIRAVFAELADQPRWVCWRYEERKGKQTKIPVQPGGRNAAVDKPRTWATLARCAAYAEATPGVGVGIVFNGDGLVGIDLDGCRDAATGELDGEARAIVADLASYAEVTPSGRGLHVLCRGGLPGGATGTRRGNVEVYAHGRFFTVTGAHLPDTPDEIADADEALERLWSTLEAPEGRRATNGHDDGTSETYQASAGPDTPWRRTNNAAFARLGAWVPELFGDAAKFVKGKGGYRIAAPDLGRDLEEDLAIMPHGIRDWGMNDLGPDRRDNGREGKRTPIDLVLEFGGAPDELHAAAWLAERLGKKLGEFGFEHGPKKRRPKPEPSEEATNEAAARGERWSDLLHRTDRGEARDVLHNVAIILRSDERFAGRLRWNLMLEAAEARDLPWHKGGWREWTDADDLQLANWCQERHAYVKPRTCAAAVQVVARDQLCHPVRDRLNALVWDGTPRLCRWLFDYLGASVEVRDGEERDAGEKRTRYLEEVGRRWMISAVARVMQPGCKADHALILEGPQGALKSTAAGALALEAAWFADEIADLGTKDSAQDLRGKWVIELAELSAMKRGEVERVKAFMSRRVDHYRPSYGVRSQDFPRQCVFIGSTNADAYLADETGGRRFWPVKVGVIDVEKLAQDRDQLWAEALAAYRKGERWWLDAEVEKAAREEQEERRIDDPWEQHVLTWLIDKSEASVEQALQGAINMPKERHDQRARNRIAAVFKAHKWSRVQKRRADGSREWLYRRPRTGDSQDRTGDSESPPDGAESSPRTGDSAACTGDTGDAKASDFNGVTSVTSVTSRFPAHMRARTHTRAALSKNACDTGDSAPPWTDDREWIARYRRALGREDRVAVVLAWGEAAGGTVRDGDPPGLTLPPDLPPGLPLVELRRLARDVKVQVAP
jgi:predicted P-loop ATPase